MSRTLARRCPHYVPVGPGVPLVALGVACIFGLTATAGRGMAQQQDAQAQFARAVQMQQAGNLEGAIEVYAGLLKAYPNSIPARSNLGAVYSRLGRFGEAIEQYKKALEFDSGNAPIRFNLGLAYYKASRLPEAAAEFARVLSEQPDPKNAAVLLADCHLRLGENKKVIDLLTPFEASHGDDLALAYLLGTALIRDNQLEKGQALVDRILSRGDSAEAHLLLGTARLMGRDHEGAIKELERALDLNPRLPSTHSYYGRALMAVGESSRALEAFRKELELQPNDFHSTFYMGVLLKQDQELDEALAHFRRALEIRPGSAEVRYQIASVHVAKQNWTEALAVLEELTRDEPNFVEAHVSLATVYYRLKRRADGDREGAIIQRLNAANQARVATTGTGTMELSRAEGGAAMAGMEPAVSSSPASPRGAGASSLGPNSEASAASTSGNVPPPFGSPALTADAGGTFAAIVARAHQAREASDFAEATLSYLQALEMQPGWTEGWWYLGTLYYGADLHLEARNTFRRVVALEPKGGAAWAFLGLCEYQLREYERALEHLQQARALGLRGNEQLTRVTRYRLALLYSRFGRFEESLKILHLLVRGSTESPTLIEGLGIAVLGMAYLPTELPPESRERVLMAGRSSFYWATYRMDDAEREHKELIARYPQIPNVHYSYGVFLLMDQPDVALEEFRRELEISPSHVRARLQIAFEYIRRNEHAAGLPYAEEAVRLEPGSFAAHNALGRILLETGDVEGAVRELEEGVRLAPDSPETRYALSRAYQRAGRRDDAARERTKFARLDKVRRGMEEESPSARPRQADQVDRPPI